MVSQGGSLRGFPIHLWRYRLYLVGIVAVLLPVYVLLLVFPIGQCGSARPATQLDNSGTGAAAAADRDRDRLPPWVAELERDCAVDLVQAERGSVLWHSWGDEELLTRAGTTASASYTDLLLEDGHGQAVSSYLAHLAPEYAYQEYARYRSTHKEHCRRTHYWAGGGGGGGGGAAAGSGSAESESQQQPVPGAHPKIAFLFLTMGSLPFARLWTAFFQGHEHLFTVYVHASPFPSVNAGAFGREHKHFWGRLVPSGHTARGTASLIAAARRLIANALLDDPLNEYFALVSEHCVPVRGFRHVYRVLTAARKSFVQQTRDVPKLWQRYTVRGVNAMSPEVNFSQFFQGSQFFILVRKHALLFTRDTKYWPKFNLPCRDHFACFPEEHYFPTVLGIEDPGGTVNHSLTFVDWSRTKTTHPRTFRKDEVCKELVTFLQYAKGGMFLFARKFADDSVDALMAVADDLLRN